VSCCSEQEIWDSTQANFIVSGETKVHEAILRRDCGRAYTGLTEMSNIAAKERHNQYFYTHALYYLGDAEGNTGTITGTGTLTIGGRDNYNDSKFVMIADFRGYGIVDMAAVDNNRRVIADGYDTERTLDMSGATTVTNTYDNGTFFGTGQFGWFAENKGKLALEEDPSWKKTRHARCVSLSNSRKFRLQ